MSKLRPSWTFYVAADGGSGPFLQDAALDPSRSAGVALQPGPVLDLAERADGRIAVLQHDALLVGDTLSQLAVVPVARSFVSNATAIAWFGDGLLVAGPGGLARVAVDREQGEWTTRHAVSNVWLDPCDRVWFGGPRHFGVAHFAGLSEWALPPEARGLGSVRVGADGHVYLALAGVGLVRLTLPDGRIEPSGLNEPDITDAEVGAGGLVRATVQATDAGGSFGRHGAVIRRPNGALEPVHFFASAQQILSCFDGRVMVLADGHVWSLVQRRWQEEDIPGPRGRQGHYRLRRGRRGSVWLCTPGGVARWLPDPRFISADLGEDEANETVAYARLPFEMTSRELGIAPVLRTGWADGRFDKKEQAELQRQLSLMGYTAETPVAAWSMSLTWVRPSEACFDDLARLAVARLGALDAPERRRQAQGILDFATAMADASGGILGLGNRICEAEQLVLNALTKALGLDG